MNGEIVSGEPDTVRLSTPNMDVPKWLSMERYVYEDPEVDEPSIYAVASDVTEVIEAYDRTHALLEKFNSLERLAGFGYWELDPRTKNVYWSSKVYELHGLADGSDTPIYEEALSFYHPEDIETVSKSVEGIEKIPGEFEFTARLVQQNGDLIMVDVHGVAIANVKGDVTKIVGTIAEHKTASTA